MSKQIKQHSEWLETIGYSSNVWLGGDWHLPMHLLSKLLAAQLSERRPLDNASDVSFKISYDSMCLLADESIGIPCLVTEKDLMIQYPNLFLAQLVQLICIRHTIDHIDPKEISSTSAPRLVFEARNGMDAQFPRCPSCHEHVFFLERVVVEKCVWHRHCFKCVECESLLKPGGFKRSKIGYECIVHGVRKILDEKEPKKSPRPAVAPPPVPTTFTMSVEQTCSEKTSEHSNENCKNQQLEPQPDAYNSLEVETKSTPSSSKRSSIYSETDSKQSKPIPPPKPKHLCSPRPKISEENASCSSDSGISFTSERTCATYDSIDDSPSTVLSESIHTTPVAPPRPKRASMLLTTGVTPNNTPNRTAVVRTPSPTVIQPPQPAPRRLNPEPEHLKTKEKQDYPDSLCPFDEDEGDNKVNFEYDESKNPFADSDDDEQTPVPAPRTTIPASLLPGESDRPKILPPPPPADHPTSPEPTNEESEFLSAQEKLRTLRLSRKKKRAPLAPNLIQRRKIVFTEKQCLDDATSISEKIKQLDEEIKKSELEGKKLEMELLFLITTNPKDWYKLPRTEEFITATIKLLDVLREQAFLQHSWRESFLNEVHSETEYMLRCLFEKDAHDEYTAHREKQLTSLLIFIIDEKAKLTETYLDNEDRSRESSLTRKETKKKTIKLRMAVLSKKLKSKKN